jgi:hypothetical protein
MPIPVASKSYLTNIAAELTNMATLVQGVKTSTNAPAPVSNLNTILASLGGINATLTQSNNAGVMTTAQRHDIGNKFQTIAAELLK